MTGKSDENQRNYLRFIMAMDVNVTTSDGQRCTMKTRNISDKGAFLENCDITPPPEGTVITLQIQDKLAEGDAPEVKAEVMHINEEGFGVRFID